MMAEYIGVIKHPRDFFIKSHLHNWGRYYIFASAVQVLLTIVHIVFVNAATLHLLSQTEMITDFFIVGFATCMRNLISWIAVAIIMRNISTLFGNRVIRFTTIIYVISLCQITTIIEMVLSTTIRMVLWYNSVTVSFDTFQMVSAAIFFPDSDPFFRFCMSSLTIFSVWHIILVSIGLSVYSTLTILRSSAITIVSFFFGIVVKITLHAAIVSLPYALYS